MEQLVNEIRPGYGDPAINERLKQLGAKSNQTYTMHYSQSEDFFLELSSPYTVPSFPIHHDVRQAVPRADYSNSLRQCMDQILLASPGIFSDLTYFFDPGEIIKPCFYRLYKIEDEYYLYLLRINLQYRPLESELLERGKNDSTAVFSTRRLYLESDVLPLASVLTELGKVIAFTVKQTISQTWIGETGQGYLVRGIWMDMELTKFFSKLFLPTGKRSYPFYPFTCKYKTICLTIPDPRPENRRTLLPYLHGAIKVLTPRMEDIQQSLKGATFSESLPLFQELRPLVQESLFKPWTNLTVVPYLNANEQKEFRVEL